MQKNSFNKFYEKTSKTLNKSIEKFNNSLIDDNEIFSYNINLFKNLNRDGKLIRGTLVKLGYNLLKDDIEYSNELALAYEIFQTSILIHDDIIDKDIKRRGKTTVHQANYEKYQSFSKNENELKHLSNSIGICIGDYGLYLASKTITDNYNDNPYFGKLITAFNDTVLKTIKGEVLDVVLPFESKNMKIDTNSLEKTIMNIYCLKTAYYTIIGPLTVGLILAGADESIIQDIKKFGEKIGIAFQIQDNLLGIFSDDTGKVTGSDIKEFKQTILFSYIVKSSYKDEFLKIYGQDNLSEEIIKQIKDIIEKSNARNYAENLMKDMYNEGLNLIKELKWINNDKKNLLIEFVEFLKNRNK